MNDQPPAGETLPTDAQRHSAVGGALAGAAVVLILVAVFAGVRTAGPDRSSVPPVPPPPEQAASASAPSTSR